MCQQYRSRFCEIALADTCSYSLFPATYYWSAPPTHYGLSIFNFLKLTNWATWTDLFFKDAFSIGKTVLIVGTAINDNIAGFASTHLNTSIVELGAPIFLNASLGHQLVFEPGNALGINSNNISFYFFFIFLTYPTPLSLTNSKLFRSIRFENCFTPWKWSINRSYFEI